MECRAYMQHAGRKWASENERQYHQLSISRITWIADASEHYLYVHKSPPRFPSIHFTTHSHFNIIHFNMHISFDCMILAMNRGKLCMGNFGKTRNIFIQEKWIPAYYMYLYVVSYAIRSVSYRAFNSKFRD